MNPAPPPAPSAARAVAATLGLLLFCVLAGSLAAAAVAPLFPDWAGRDLVRLARRCMMLCGLAAIPVYLRVIGSRGRVDAGWSGLGPAAARRELGRGVALGLATLLPLLALSLWVGTREWHPAHATPRLVLRGFTFALSAAVVGVLEETLVRGFLFLPLRRAMGLLPAALLGGIVFAWAHFIEPSAEALRLPGFAQRAAAVATSGLAHLAGVEHVAPRAANLVLMSVALAAATGRTGTIWLAAGLHASWVWVKKVNAIVSDTAAGHPARAWIGSRSDFLDGWVCSLLLLALTVALLRPVRPQGVSTGS